MIRIYDETALINLADIDNIIIDCEVQKVINGKDTFTFTVLQSELKTNELLIGNTVRIGEQIYVIVYIENTHSSDGRISFYVECEHWSYNLLNFDLVDFTSTGTYKEILDDMLEGTGFHTDKVDELEYDETYSITGMTVREGVIDFCNKYDLKLVFDNLRVNAKNEISEYKGFMVEFGKNLKGITRYFDNREGDDEIYYKIDLLELGESELYKSLGYENLETVDVGDQIGIKDELMNIDIIQDVVSISYNPLKRVNTSLEITKRIKLSYEEDVDTGSSLTPEQESDIAKIPEIEEKVDTLVPYMEYQDTQYMALLDYVSNMIKGRSYEYTNSEGSYMKFVNGLLVNTIQQAILSVMYDYPSTPEVYNNTYGDYSTWDELRPLAYLGNEEVMLRMISTTDSNGLYCKFVRYNIVTGSYSNLTTGFSEHSTNMTNYLFFRVGNYLVTNGLTINASTGTYYQSGDWIQTIGGEEVEINFKPSMIPNGVPAYGHKRKDYPLQSGNVFDESSAINDTGYVDSNGYIYLVNNGRLMKKNIYDQTDDNVWINNEASLGLDIKLNRLVKHPYCNSLYITDVSGYSRLYDLDFNIVGDDSIIFSYNQLVIPWGQSSWAYMENQYSGDQGLNVFDTFTKIESTQKPSYTSTEEFTDLVRLLFAEVTGYGSKPLLILRSNGKFSVIRDTTSTYGTNREGILFTEEIT